MSRIEYLIALCQIPNDLDKSCLLFGMQTQAWLIEQENGILECALLNARPEVNKE